VRLPLLFHIRLHLAPRLKLMSRVSGLIHKGCICVIGQLYDLLKSGAPFGSYLVCPRHTPLTRAGNGVVVHLAGLLDEIAKNESKGLTDWQGRCVCPLGTHRARTCLCDRDMTLFLFAALDICASPDGLVQNTNLVSGSLCRIVRTSSSICTRCSSL
jgi:hypothetical protein